MPVGTVATGRCLQLDLPSTSVHSMVTLRSFSIGFLPRENPGAGKPDFAPMQIAYQIEYLIAIPELEHAQLIENRRRRCCLIANKPILLPNRIKPLKIVEIRIAPGLHPSEFFHSEERHFRRLGPKARPRRKSAFSLRRMAMCERPYSYRNPSTGSSREARIAGINPLITPTITSTATETPRVAREMWS